MKRGQLQIGESIMVLIILVFIGIVALVFAVRYADANFEEKLLDFEDLNTLEVAQASSNLFELRCAKPGITDLCFDLHKVIALAKLREDKPLLVTGYFQDLFSNSKVTLQELYPAKENYTIYWKNASLLNEGTGEFGPQTATHVAIPVPLHNSSKDKVSFGILVIDRYFRTRGAN